jgi:hypothetical protein
LKRFALYFLIEHDLFGKPVSTFPDHALINQRAHPRQQRSELVLEGQEIESERQRRRYEHPVLNEPSPAEIALAATMRPNFLGPRFDGR